MSPLQGGGAGKNIPQDEEAKPVQGYQIDENMPETIAYGRNATAGDTVAYIPTDAGMIGELLYQNEDMVPQNSSRLCSNQLYSSRMYRIYFR